MTSVDARFVARLFPAQVSVAIATEQMFEMPLLAGESALIEGAVAKRRREFAGGRNAARAALDALGFAPMPILRRDARAPAWPEGAVGSITHCADFVCAVAARSSRFVSLGIDAERAQRMEAGLAELVCREDEFSHFAELPAIDGVDWAAIAFSAKEAAYKCLSFMLDAILDFRDVSLRFAAADNRRAGRFQIDACARCPELETAGLIGRWAVTGTMILSSAYICKGRVVDAPGLEPGTR
ncbi:MAG TPA: 4'-phosphopantetheinyl transferase superfamily protein [Allosphingosinicella sp.]|nr:4'-phosphopantetheinyl transferase superfamily protein [Allosphingosinicella sp.]